MVALVGVAVLSTNTPVIANTNVDSNYERVYEELERGYITNEIEQGLEFEITDLDLFLYNFGKDEVVNSSRIDGFLGTPSSISTRIGNTTRTGRWWSGFTAGSANGILNSQVIANTNAQGRASVTLGFN